MYTIRKGTQVLVPEGAVIELRGVLAPHREQHDLMEVHEVMPKCFRILPGPKGTWQFKMDGVHGGRGLVVFTRDEEVRAGDTLEFVWIDPKLRVRHGKVVGSGTACAVKVRTTDRPEVIALGDGREEDSGE